MWQLHKRKDEKTRREKEKELRGLSSLHSSVSFLVWSLGVCDPEARSPKPSQEN